MEINKYVIMFKTTIHYRASCSSEVEILIRKASGSYVL